MNRITKSIPDEAKIADELQEMKDEDGQASIIRWALENNGKQLKEWCYLDDEGELQGPLAKRFEQAIRLEGSVALTPVDLATFWIRAKLFTLIFIVDLLNYLYLDLNFL